MTFFKKSLALVIVIVFFALMFSCSHEHEFGEWEISMQPTCVEGGERIRTCTSCGEAESESVPMLLHDELQHEGKAATCTEDGCTSYVTCSRCDYTTYQKIDALGHNEVYHEPKEPNCNESGWAEYVTCSVCDYSTYKELPKLAHVMAEIPEKPATCTEEGLTSGIYCTLCDKIMRSQKTIPMISHNSKQGLCTVCGEEDYTDPRQYGNDHCYTSLLRFGKGKAMQKLYDRINEVVMRFHFDYTTDFPIGYGRISDRIYYSDLGLTDMEASIALNAFYNDNRIFFWLSGLIASRSSVENGKTQRYMVLCIEDGCEKGADRKRYAEQIYAKIKEYHQLVKGETDKYNIALAYHDVLMADVSYAHEQTGTGKSMPGWVRNLVGPLCMGKAVCAGYARAYNVLMNLSGVKTVHIEGSAGGEGHLWNVMQLDDGKWYVVDVTWDDPDGTYFPYQHAYFCISCSDIVNYRDRYTSSHALSVGNKTFFDNHTTDAHNMSAPVGKFNFYRMPIADKPYDNKNSLGLRDTFTVEKNTYALVSYKKVQLVYSTNGALLNVPETVNYNGIEYDVVSVGFITDSGLFDGTRTVSSTVLKQVVIPVSVEYIWSDAICNPQRPVKIFYCGTQSQWKAVEKQNARFSGSKIYYYSETAPTASGNYWHYVNGQPTPW